MSSKHLHIVSFNVPYPADYGGAIDVFYRIKALHEAGVKIHLHCFRYGRLEAAELNIYCETVHYYSRSLSIIKQFSSTPFIVKTRANKLLLKKLINDDYPILFEGLHCCFFLNHELLADRKKIVRCHNIEYNYYHGLALKAKNLKDYFYFRLEALKLKHFENILKFADHIAAISEADKIYFQNKYGKTFLLRPSHQATKIEIKQGKGHYLLYHGDLSTQENIESAMLIINEISKRVEHEFVLAGKNPSQELIKATEQTENVRVIANPNHNKMQELIANAHINILPTSQATGFKLKLLNALFNGRFCLVTPEMVEGTGLSNACVIASGTKDFQEKIEALFINEFSDEDVQKRTALLDKFSNNAAISRLLEII